LDGGPIENGIQTINQIITINDRHTLKRLQAANTSLQIVAAESVSYKCAKKGMTAIGIQKEERYCS
jgi:hypothetical protein